MVRSTAGFDTLGGRVGRGGHREQAARWPAARKQFPGSLLSSIRSGGCPPAKSARFRPLRKSDMPVTSMWPLLDGASTFRERRLTESIQVLLAVPSSKYASSSPAVPPLLRVGVTGHAVISKGARAAEDQSCSPRGVSASSPARRDMKRALIPLVR
jgi:hypothetical protein